MRTYRPPVVHPRKARKGKTIPDQSLTIQEIWARYVKGVPADVQEREAVYIDQQDADLEKLSRADFGEKAEYAREFQARAAQIQSDHAEAVRRVKEERAKAAEAAKKAAEPPKKPGKGATGIDPLDDTMPVD